MGLFDSNEIRSLFKEIPATSVGKEENSNNEINKFLEKISSRNADIYIFNDTYPQNSPKVYTRGKNLNL